MTVVAAVLASVAVVLWVPPPGWLLRHRLGLPVRVPPWRAIVLAAAGVVGALVVPALHGVSLAHVVAVSTVVGVGVFCLRHVRAERHRAVADRRRAAVAEALGLMAAELRGGVLPQRVIAGLVDDFDFLGPAARAAELGADVSSSLRSAAQGDGYELLEQVAGAWLVADRAGAPLARVLERLEQAARSDREIEREVRSGVAPARATGRLMAILPLVGLGLGSGMGGDPVGVLVGTLPGVLCLALGAALACVGVAWIERIAHGVETAR